jgi:tetratricopeptide (TPR) repeat protein
MANKKVKLYKYVKLSNGSWRYCAAVFSENKKLKPHVLQTPSGAEERHDEGQYYLGYARKWESAGNDPVEALRLLRKKEGELSYTANGGTLRQQEERPTGGIRRAAEDWLDEIKDGDWDEDTYNAKRLVMDEFIASAKVKTLDAITRKNCLQYINASLKEQGNSDRTRFNKFLHMSGNAEANKFYKDAQDQYQRNDTQAEVASLRRAVEIDPKWVRAWLWLGDIYKATRQNDLALESYRKAVEDDPDQAVSYKALGFMLSSLGKTEEAVPVWQQLVKVAPERVDGYAELGMALLYLKRYREAVSSLESAVKLFPDWAPLQLNLGNAYLNTGDIDKSRSAFETALKLDSNPAILNDISYSLAERSTDLEKAKEYAEKAVHAEEAASATMQLSGLQASDLDHAPRLAMFWDTLGWVYSRLNDLVPAEAYLKAAWTLNQRPAIGGHLGHVYEQQGKKAAALHAYQLAYTSSPSRIVSPLPTGAPAFTKDASDLEKDIRRLGGKLESPDFRDDLNHARTFKIPRVVSGTASAEFFVLIGPGDKVEAKFISGSDSLKSVQKMLESTNFNVKFPDDHPTRILRRGILGCYQYTGCTFVLLIQ